MSLIMELIEPELSYFSALELENLPYLTLTNQYQTWPTICMPIRFRMSLIMVQIESEHSELFAFEFGKIVEYDFVYSLSSTNID